MRITWIGGRERNAGPLQRVALDAGHELEVHDGHTSARSMAALRASIERADLVIIETDVNSHGAVLFGKKLCHKLGRSVVVLRRLGTARFQTLLDTMLPNEARFRAAS